MKKNRSCKLVKKVKQNRKVGGGAKVKSAKNAFEMSNNCSSYNERSFTYTVSILIDLHAT